MSDIFLKKDIRNKRTVLKNTIFSTTSNNFIQGGGNTSSANMSKINATDINNLLAMLTSESNSDNAINRNGGGFTNYDNYTENTEVLENKLIKILNNKNDNLNSEQLQNKINNLIIPHQSGGGRELASLATLATLGAVGALATSRINNNSIKKSTSNTETEFNSGTIINKGQNVIPTIFPNIVSTMPNVIGNKDNKITVTVETPTDVRTSETSPNLISDMNNNLSDTSNSIFQKNPVNKKNSFINTTTSLNNSDLSPTSSAILNTVSDPRLNKLQQGGRGTNVGFENFLKVAALVATKLNIPNSAKAKKIAGQLQRDVKEKNKDITSDKMVNVAEKHLIANLEKYKKMI